jgi:hypothetical protein
VGTGTLEWWPGGSITPPSYSKAKIKTDAIPSRLEELSVWVMYFVCRVDANLIAGAQEEEFFSKRGLVFMLAEQVFQQVDHRQRNQFRLLFQ